MLEKKVCGTILLTILLTSTLVLAFSIQPAKASGTIYIRADGSIDPPTAPISTFDNITYTLTSNINSTGDGIVIERDNIILDGADHNIQGTEALDSTGIALIGRTNVTIWNMEIRLFCWGIYIDYSSNINLTRNNIEENSTDPNSVGIVIYSSNNSVIGNNVTGYMEIGIFLGDASYNKILVNNITRSNYGVCIIHGSNNNSVSGNNIEANGHGILLAGWNFGGPTPKFNSIDENNIKGNLFGIEFDESSNNFVYHNNIENARTQVQMDNDGETSLDAFDSGYPSGGNYWSDYTGVDLYSGPYQNETGSDGIGDTPYVIDSNNQDNYPLMKPYVRARARLHRNVTADAFSVFGNIDFSNITLYYIDVTYHYSSVSPGAFYVDDILLFKSTITVPDDYPTIQAAINAASDGDTVFVRNGTYYENVVVSKQVRLLGENRVGTIIDANATGTVLNIVANNVSVSGFKIKGSGSTCPDSGVLLQGVANCRIFGNRIIENLGDGIFLMSCSDNVIFGNEVVGNDVDGISVSGSAGNTISDNNVTGNGWSGIGLFGYSSDNNVASNNVVNNPEGIAVVISARNEISENTVVSSSNWGISIYQSLNNSIFHNEFNNSLQVNSDGSPNTWDNGYPYGGNYWSDYSGTDVYSGPYQNETGSDGLGDTLYAIDANNTDSFPLVHPYGSIQNLNTSLVYLTIQSAINAPETLDGDTLFVRNGTYYESLVVNKAISLVGENPYDTTIDGGGLAAYVVSVTANDAQISGFRIVDGGVGIYVDSVNRTVIINNLFDQLGLGISLQYSQNNTIVGNTISNCNVRRSSAAFGARYSNGSMIYHNNFIHNGRPPNVIIDSFNTWDNGYPSGGNYWTTYKGVPINSPDLYSGPCQNQTGSDGILDYEYYDNWQGTPIIDYYPLTKPWPWGPHDVGITNIDKGTLATVVWSGSKLDISVCFMNYGYNSEVLNVTFYVNTTLINEATNFALASRDSTVLNITWDTTGFAKGNYTISAYAWPVPGETDIADNTYVGGTVEVLAIPTGGGGGRMPYLT